MLRNRRLCAALLLSVLVPAILASSFHRHQPAAQTDAVCEACEHHLPHPGHMGDGGLDHDCLFCHFLAVLFLPVPVLLISDSVRRAARLSGAVRRLRFLSGPAVRATRGPPALLCL
ncbi:MAG: hypothetical protein IJV37_03175 [Bacteroidales bacterium]|nr:hypothetical protein [Bacteroidales bacterium]